MSTNVINPITAKVDLETLTDIISTALEGGSNYWYFIGDDTAEIIRSYKKKGEVTLCFSEALLPAVLDGKILKIHDLEDQDGDPIGELSLDSINKGLEKMKADKREELSILSENNLEADYDASDADVIFQYITLGEIVFG